MTLQRRIRIVELLRERGVVRVGELAALFQTSEVTIRNDLTQLEREGQLIRDRGGAIASGSKRQITSLLALEHRARLQTEEKQRIGRAAAQLVNPGDTIIMDAGTTVVEMARHLAGISSLTVVTNALNVAVEVAAATDARLILLGGTVNREASSTVGPIAEQTLSELTVQKVFLGTQAFDFDHGLTDTTIEIAQVKRAMIRSARQTILLSDSSKWGKTGFIKVVPITAIHTILTDAGLSDEPCKAIERAGIHLQQV